jgi:muramidase (phage lysozyme)
MRSDSPAPAEAESTAPSQKHRPPVKPRVDRFIGRWLLRSILVVVTAASLLDLYEWRYGKLDIFEPRGEVSKPIPLAMAGGDPHIRALMRTISASESNVPKPYSVIYGGDYFESWNRHPDRCVYIPVGPNEGNCSTAAGRYQFITTTWEAEAQRYHPEQPKIFFWRPYPFDPESQDIVMYRWLSDASAWGADLTQLLREGQIETVLELLSPTWTSLGYGIETNSMSAYLPEIYVEMLEEEIAALVPAGEPTARLPAGTPWTGTEPLRTDAEVFQQPAGEAIANPGGKEPLAEPGSHGAGEGDAIAFGSEQASDRPNLREGLAELRSGSQKLLRALLGQ